MKYKVITYRSRRLMSPCGCEEGSGAAESASDFGIPAAGSPNAEADELLKETPLSRRERRAQQRMLKKEKKESERRIMISGESFNPNDYDPEEISDMQAAEKLNRDNFYSAKEPIDYGTAPARSRGSHTFAVIAGACVVTAVIVIAMIIFLVTSM